MPRALADLDPTVASGPGNAVGPIGPAGPPGPQGNQPFDVQIFSGEQATTEDSPVRAGARFLDLTPFPALHPSGLTRVGEFVANIEVSGGTGTVRLRNRDDVETVTGTEIASLSLTNIEVRSGPLTVGVAAGNLKDDKMYKVEIFHTGGTPSDAVTLTNARLEISYV